MEDDSAMPISKVCAWCTQYGVSTWYKEVSLVLARNPCTVYFYTEYNFNIAIASQPPTYLKYLHV